MNHETKQTLTQTNAFITFVYCFITNKSRKSKFQAKTHGMPRRHASYTSHQL